MMEAKEGFCCKKTQLWDVESEMSTLEHKIRIFEGGG